MGSLPSLHEVEEMINVQRQNQEALLRIRNAVLTQEHAMAEQMAQRKAYKASGVDEEMAMYQEEFKGSGGFAGAEAKKRRGVRSYLLSIFCTMLTILESCTSWTLPQLQPSGNPRMATRP